jgi:hypothetical protein
VIVTLATLLGGMPLTLGIDIHRSKAAFTLNICGPVQSFSHSAVSVVAIVFSSPSVAQVLPGCGGPCPSAAQELRVRAADAPDPPPPKARA